MSIRAIVVDDEPLARDELRFMLGQCENVEVVGEARNATEARGLCDEEQPDLAFLDLRMPGPDGVALVRLSQDQIEVAVVEIDIAVARDKAITKHNDKLADRRPDLYRL